MHALTIEDDELVAAVIEDILRACGFTSFDAAISLDEAVIAARKRCPNLITADVELKLGPASMQYRPFCSEAPIPVVFITGRPDAARSQMPQHPTLGKPFAVSEVETAVRRLICQ